MGFLISKIIRNIMIKIDKLVQNLVMCYQEMRINDNNA